MATMTVFSLENEQKIAPPKNALQSIYKLSIALFFVHAFLLLIGYQCLPLVPALDDEVILSDPAVSLIQSGHYACDSFAPNFYHLDQFFGHHPPLAMLLQALFMKIFGLTIFALRGSSILAAACWQIFASLLSIELFKQRLISYRATLASIAIFSLEPSSIMFARRGRMESLGELMTTICIWLLIREYGKLRNSTLVLNLAGIAVGLALSTHFAAVLMMPFFVSMLFIACKGKLKRMFMPLLLSGLTPLTLWTATLREHTLDGFKQMSALFREAPGPLLRDWHSYVSQEQPVRSLFNLGSTMMVLLLLSCVVFLYRTITLQRTDGWKTLALTSKGQLALACTLSAGVVFLCPLFIMPFNPTRLLLAAPLIVIGIGFFFSLLDGCETNPQIAQSQGGSTRIVGAFSLVMGLILITLTSYFARLPKDWRENDPKNFDAIAKSIPASDRVFAPSRLWWAFRSERRNVIVNYRLTLRPYWLENPSYLDGFDTIITLDDDPYVSELQTFAIKNHPFHQTWKSGEYTFEIYRKQRFSEKTSNKPLTISHFEQASLSTLKASSKVRRN